LKECLQALFQDQERHAASASGSYAGDDSQFIAARIQRLTAGQAEKLAVVELQRAVSAARSFAIRKEPLVPEEQVVTLAYPAGRFHLVGGRFVQLGDGGKLAGTALLEMYEGENRLVIDHGASGAPVVDCDGRVAAVVSNVFTQSIVWVSQEVRISTAWECPTSFLCRSRRWRIFPNPTMIRKGTPLNSSPR